MSITSHQPLVFLFSGQGSHYYHMGRELYLQNSCFKHWMQLADELLKPKVGVSVLESLYHDNFKKSDLFKRTLVTHPAIFMLQYALAQTLIEEGVKPDYVLGTSLGEFAAAAIAGCLDFESALNAVILQAQMIENYCSPAQMLAVLHTPQTYNDHPTLSQYSELASINFDQHFVITCKQDALSKAEGLFKEKQITYQILAVDHGFHSQYIDNAAMHYLHAISNVTIKSPSIPLISCMTATSIERIDHQHLWDVIRKPILFQQTIHNLEKLNNYNYVDVGPSGTLATFAKYNLSNCSHSKAIPILTPYGHDVENLARTISALAT